ncbi:MAG: 2-dehydropantoate 2-reductase [Verrucomicrobiales bacterium]|nr:2-dehydropantoate 2-reductase [Verrucomicrobiales bacterium]
MAEIKTIAIVGSGAVGAYYGARLAMGAGATVSFLMRRDLKAVREAGLRIKSVDGDFDLNPTLAFPTTEEIGPVDLVIIALKATSNNAIPELLPPLLKAKTRILTLQNGLGNEEFLSAHFPRHPILGGLCFVCINRGEPGVIHHLAHGRVEMGELNGTGSVEEVQPLFTRAGLDARLLPNLGLARWRKLIWNIPFNGLSIAEGCIDTKQILANPKRVDRVRALMNEVIAAAAAFDYEIDPSFAEGNITGTAEMGAYRPSSLIDFEAGQSVEVEPIWGEPLRRAKEKGIEMPELTCLYQQICAAVESRSS